MKFAVTIEEIEKWTADMVRIPSYPGIPNQEMEVAKYIKSVFDAEGIDCHIDELDDGRANAVAVLKGKGTGKSLMLCGHTDTVPPYDMEDALEPWTENGCLHGRGANDMKGELAAAMAALISLKRQGKQLDGDLILAAVADEEEGSLGCIRLIQTGYTADACVICESLDMDKIAVLQKGLEWYQIDFKGRTVHGGSWREGINAIEKASHFIALVEQELRPKLEQRTAKYGADSTVNIAVIKGGSQPSTVAGECQILLDRRFLPGSEPYETVTAELQEMLDRLAAEDPDFHATLSIYPPSIMVDGFVHQGFITDENHPLVTKLHKAVKDIWGVEPQNSAGKCWTDGGLVSHYAKIPTVVYGPNNMALCHSKEEMVVLDELLACGKIYQQLAESFCVAD